MPGTVFAQIDLSNSLSTFAHAIQQSGYWNNARQQNPLEPTTGPPPASEEGDLPTPMPQDSDSRRLQFDSGHFERHGNILTAAGGVHCVYRGYDLFGDSMEADLASEIFTLTGDAKVIGIDHMIHGQTITFDYKTGRYRAENSKTDLKPSFFKTGNVQGDVFTKGDEIYGSLREQFSRMTSTTTCTYEAPHYEILADSTDIRPGKRIIMRGVTVVVLNHKILRLPYLSLPLDDRYNRYIPEVGDDPTSGLYIKFKYPVPIHGNDNFIDLHFDEYQKLGTGLGADWNYGTRTMNGYLKVYHIFGQNSSTDIEQHHDQRFGNFEITLDNSFQDQNYLLAPENKIFNSTTRVSYNSKGSLTSLGYQLTDNRSPDFVNTQTMITFDDNRQWNTRIHSDLNLGLSKNHSSATGGVDNDQEQLTVNATATDNLGKATAEMDYQRTIPVGSNPFFFAPADKTPVLSLTSSSEQLWGRSYPEQLPRINLIDVSFGDYTDPSLQQHVSRTGFDLDVNKSDSGLRRLGFGLDAQYHQMVYSDDTAQYVLNLNTTGRYTLGRDTSINANYTFLQPHGFSPLQIDRTGITNVANANILVNTLKNLQWGLQTGYDFQQAELGEQTPWQTLAVTTNWRPQPFFMMRALSTYDPFSKAWSDFRFDLSYKPGATFVSIGSQYDPIRHTWGQANLFIDSLKWGRLRFSTVLAYNGYLREFEAQHFSFTYDLHCAEAILQILNNPVGFRPGTQIAFFIRLKAFPFDTPFGIGTQGQAIGTGFGRGPGY